MDARTEEQFHRRTSTKRPWEDEDTLVGQSNSAFERTRFARGGFSASHLGHALHSSSLPPIDDMTFRRPATQQAGEPLHGFSNHRYGTDLRASVYKRPKVEEQEYNAAGRRSIEFSAPNFMTPQPLVPNAGYAQDVILSEPSTGPQISTVVALNNTAGPQSSSILCRRCKTLATQEADLELYGVPDSCEVCRKNPALGWVTQAAAAGLTKLAETLRSGISSEQRGIIRTPDRPRSSTTNCPTVLQSGLKETLDWILGKVNEINYLADDLARQTIAGLSNDLRTGSLEQASTEDGFSNMKRRIDVDSEEIPGRLKENLEPTSDAKAYTRRRSDTSSLITSQSEQRPSYLHYDSRDPQESRESLGKPNYLPEPARKTFMNPPPTPARNLPSPTGRSFPSPVSTSFPSPSPSSSSMGIPPHSAGRLPAPLVHQTTINTYLPPINGTHSPDSALRDHSAALQHEVSVQKIALSSLQGEHDKLLSAFSRSQLRASALEKKHAVSDNEIISLTEEKLRLQQQVIELERDVEELTRSRDETRQAAVQEGAQYVQIVGRATRLEELAGEERRSWNRLRDDMEKRITLLSMGAGGNEIMTSTQSHDLVAPDSPVVQALRTDTIGSSVADPIEVKIENTNDPVAYTSHPISTTDETTSELKEEIRALRERCKKMEEALRSVRSMGRALIEHAGSVIIDE